MPEAEIAPPAAEESAPTPPAKKSGTGLIVTIALVVAIAGGVGGFLKFRHPATPAAPKTTRIPAKKEAKEVKSILHLESFVVNLGGADEKAYLRVGVDLGLSGEGKGEKADAALETALVRDTLLTTLATAKPDELLTVEGKAKLKADLIRALQQRAPELGVLEIYFNEFLIQR